VDGFFEELNAAVAEALPEGFAATAAAPVDGGTWPGKLSAFLAARRQGALGVVLDQVEWDGRVPSRSFAAFSGTAAWLDPIAHYAEVRRQVTALQADVAMIERLLRAGYALSDPVEGASVAALFSRWEGDALAAEPAVAAALQPTVAHVRLLRDIGAGTDRARLCSLAAESPEFTVALAAWRRLGELTSPVWPHALAELEQEQRLGTAVTDAVGALKEAARREAVVREISRERMRRWQAGVNALTADAEMTAALALLPGFGVAPADLDPLAPRIGQSENILTAEARFNILLCTFRGAHLWGLDDAAALAARDSFVARLKRLPGDMAAAEPVGPFIARLAALAPIPAESEPDLSRAGPGAAGWSLDPGVSTPASVTFRRQFDDRQHTLTFRKVPPPEPGRKAAYVGTTEVAFGLFRDALDASGDEHAWDELSRLFEPGFIGQLKLGDPRRGPRVWELSMAGTDASLRFKTAEAWTADVLWPAKPDYAEGLTVPPPSDDCPMQRVSPGAALYCAQLLGCRLPTVAEWQAACVQAGEAPAGLPQNRRDRAWEKQRQHAAALRTEGFMLGWPGDGIFRPDGTAEEDFTQAVPLASDTDDGVLWFAPVPTSSPEFSHLMGNVSEYVLGAVPAEPVQGGAPSAAAVAGLLAAAGTRVLVIGGSALSPPSVDADRPYAFRLEDAARGYADVGFRLAFSAPRETTAERLMGLVQKQTCLKPRQEG
jgi:formylglycine-generating enzyme required for sulfatase activity